MFINAIRRNIAQMLWKSDQKISTVAHIFVTFLIVSTVVTISVIVGDVSTVFGFLGSTTSPTGGYILPAIFVWKLVPKGEKKYKNIKIIALIMAVMIMLLSVGSLSFKIWALITDHSVSCGAVYDADA